MKKHGFVFISLFIFLAATGFLINHQQKDDPQKPVSIITIPASELLNTATETKPAPETNSDHFINSKWLKKVFADLPGNSCKSAQSISDLPDWTTDGEDQPGNFYGYSVAAAGDINGDGYSDVIIGAFGLDGPAGQDEGAVYIFRGSASGLPAGLNNAQKITCGQAGAFFGYSVAGAGDINNDGYSDIIIGARDYKNSSNDPVGAAFIFYGSSGQLSSVPDITILGDQTESWFGYSVSSAGDVNGDGYSDVIVGAPLYDNLPENRYNEGWVYVYNGSSLGLNLSSPWIGTCSQAEANLGRSVSTAGDVNGDGYSDIIAGASHYDPTDLGDAGGIFAFYGSSAGLPASGLPSWQVDGYQFEATLGMSVSTAGDVNGDGYSDVIAGSPGFDDPDNPGIRNLGAVFAYYGSATGLNTTADWSVTGDQAEAELGSGVSIAGDMNGDGYSEVVVGAWLYDVSEELSNAGKIYIYNGSYYGLSTLPYWQSQDAFGSYLGESVSTAGDVNGDGYSDILAGSPDTDGSKGKAVSFYGSVDGIMGEPYSTAEGNRDLADLGYSAASAGDVNGDGYTDIIAGAVEYSNGEDNEGAAFLYLGSASGIAAVPSWSVEGNLEWTSLGYSVASAGDVNGDGYSDVIIGSPYYSDYEHEINNQGRILLYYGSPSGLNTAPLILASGEQGASFGYSVASAGDVNGDGYSDIIIGAPYFTDHQQDPALWNCGRAYVYYGAAAGLNTTNPWIWTHDKEEANFGWSVSTAGDVNGDGFSDIVIGAIRHDIEALSGVGAVFVFHGSASGLNTSPNKIYEGGQGNMQLGSSVSTAGDVNGDGFSDVIAGAHYYDVDGRMDAGIIYVYAGSSGGLSDYPNWTYMNNQANSKLGASVSSAGDVNGDGYSDVIVGAPGYNSGRGEVYLWYGSVSGVDMQDGWRTAGSNNGFALGHSVAAAGDVNADGFGDVIIGVPYYQNTYSSQGQILLYNGNSLGKEIRPSQFRPDLATRVIPALKTRSSSQAGLSIMGRTFFGRSKVKVQFEVKPLGQAFNGTGLTESAWTDAGVSGIQVNQLIGSLIDRTLYRWRARLHYSLVQAAPQPFGRWIYQPYNGGLGEADFQASSDDNPLPVVLCSFSAKLIDGKVCLSWTTATEINNLGFEVERKLTNQGSIKENWKKLGFVKGSGNSNSPKYYSFIDDKANLTGKYIYRLNQIGLDGKNEYSFELDVALDNADSYTLYPGYPNPFNPLSTISYSLLAESHVKLTVYNSVGQKVKELTDEIQPAGFYKTIWNASEFASGVYFYKLETRSTDGKNTYNAVQKVMLIK